MLPRHIRYHRARCDRLGNNPPLLLIAPPSAADNAAVATEVIGVLGLTVLLIIVAAIRGLGHWSNLGSTGIVPS